MIKKRSLLDKLGGKTTTQLPAASVNSALSRSVGGYQPTIQPIQQPIIPKPILPSVNLSRPVTRDLGTQSLRESTQRANAKQSVVDAKVEKQTKQNASDRAKMLERQLSDKYGIDVKRANSPIEAVNMLSMVDDSQKEQFKKDFAEYSFAAERSNPFRAGAEAGFNILPTNLEKTEGKEDVQTANGYGAGRLVGGIGQQLAFNSALGGGIESLTSKLLPKATPFVTETIKDVAIGTGTQLAEAPFDKPTAGQFAGNVALDIALNALFGVVGKGLSKVDLSNLKTAKPSQVVGDVAQKLNVSIVEADKLVDDAIDFYVNQSGVADTKPFEQLQLPSPSKLSEKVRAANVEPQFRTERPNVLMQADLTAKQIEPTLNVASKVDQPTTTMKIEPTLKPKKQVEAEAKLKAKQETVSGLSSDKLADAFSGKISRDVKTKKPSFKQRWEQLKTQFVDDTTPLRRLEEKVKGKLSSAESSIYKQARLFKGAPETANEFIRVRLAPVLTDIEKKGLSTDDLGDYALAVHARDVNNADINSGFTNEEIDAVIKKFEGNKDMETARKELLKISDDLLEQLSADELIDANQLKALKEKWTNYMPLFRAFDDDKVDFAKGLSDSFSNVTAPIKKLSGSDRNVIDPIESMIKNIYQTTSATMRNSVGLQLTKLAEIDVDNRFIRKLDDKELVGRKNVVNVTENGKKVAYEVDPEVFKTFNNLDKETSSKIIEWLAKPASVLRAGATLTPEFAIRNPFRDIQTAFVNSESGFTPLDFVRGLASTIKKDELYSQFLKEGGGYGGIFSVDRNSSNKILKDILKTPVTDKFVNVVSGKSLIRLLRAISDTTESATKVGEFGAALRRGATPSEAAYRAKDMMDFARAGSSIRQWNRITAFMNASIQGKSRLLRSIKERPVGTMLKMTTTMTLPTLGIYAANERLANDKQRQIIDEAPDWLKNTFWLAAIPGTDLVARIPKPFDMSIFANGTERFLDYLKKNDKEAFDGFIRQSIKDQSIPVMITGLAPFLEVMSNYSQFRQSPIIPLREQYVKKEDQYDNTTSELSKLLASGARKVLGEESNFGSPRAMDYALKTSTGGLGTTILDASDWVASSLGISDRPSRAEKGITNAPGLKGFLVSETLSAKSVGNVYDLADKLQREKGSLKLKLQEKYGDRYNSDDLKREFKNQEQLTYLNQITDAMSDISKELRATNNSKDMTPHEKRKVIEELTTERNNLAVEAMKKIKEMGK